MISTSKNKKDYCSYLPCRAPSECENVLGRFVCHCAAVSFGLKYDLKKQGRDDLMHICLKRVWKAITANAVFWRATICARAIHAGTEACAKAQRRRGRVNVHRAIRDAIVEQSKQRPAQLIILVKTVPVVRILTRAVKFCFYPNSFCFVAYMTNKNK